MNAAKPRLPEGMAAVVDEARERHLERFCPPSIAIERTKDGWQFSSPYAEEDADAYWALLFDAFGTRNPGVVDHFLDVLTNLCPNEWDKERQTLIPCERDFQAIISIVGSMRPENEAQAAHCAQLAALHLSAMKLAERSLEWGDPRTAAILNKTVRAFGDGMERLARLQGKVAPRAIHQTYEVHKHDHMHFSPSSGSNGGQAHGATTSAPIPCAALPRPCEVGTALQMPCREGQEGLPRAWWGARLWRTIGRA